jgi:tetratricopeptide (TPR) repeat protein
VTLIVAAMFGRSWIRNPEWKSNATLAAAAHRDHPDAIASLVMYGNMLATTGELDRGVAMLERAVEIDPGFTVAHRALGKAYQVAGDLERSLAHWRIAEMQFPGHPEVEAALQIVGSRLAGRRQDELRAARHAAEAEAENVEAELRYVRMLIDLGQHGEALARMKAADKRFHAHAAWHRQFAVAWLYAGRRDAAIARYRRCLELAPTDAGVMVELAALLLERRDEGDEQRAEELVRSALELTPSNPNARILQAEMFAMHGDVQKALRVYTEVIDSLPSDSPRRAAWQSRARALAGE